MDRKDLLKHESYWLAKIQMDLYSQIEKYLKNNNLSKTAFAEKLGVSKGYVSQVLNGDFDHKLSRLVKLAMATGKVPKVTFENLNEIIENDANEYRAVYKEFHFDKDMFFNKSELQIEWNDQGADFEIDPNEEKSHPIVLHSS